MRPTRGLAPALPALRLARASAEYRVTRYFALVKRYKSRCPKLRDRCDPVIIDGTCNSAGTLVLGIVPFNRICVTPRRGFHAAYFDKSWTFGIPVTSQPMFDIGP